MQLGLQTGLTRRSHYSDRSAVTAKSFVEQENLSLVQLDNGVLIHRKLTQAPEGIGGRPGDAQATDNCSKG